MTLGSIIAFIASMSILFVAGLVGTGLAFGAYLIYDVKIRKIRADLSKSQVELGSVRSEVRLLMNNLDELREEYRATERTICEAEQRREEAEAALQAMEKRRAAFSRIRI